MTKLDARFHAYRPDLADLKLSGQVEASTFVAGVPAQIGSPIATLHRMPAADSMQITQALMGETCVAFERKNGWAWVQLGNDGYVGYVLEQELSHVLVQITHRVCVPSTFLYQKPNIKTQPAISFPMNAALGVKGFDGDFAEIASSGFIFAAHIVAANAREHDFVAVAEKYLNVPYLWGGKSSHGIDCSGLVQLALEACGTRSPRDSDMQEEQLGMRLMVNDLDGLKRGDLVFWDGHVGIMRDSENLLHANGHHMSTVLEPLKSAVARIAAKGHPITSIKRL